MTAIVLLAGGLACDERQDADSQRVRAAFGELRAAFAARDLAAACDITAGSAERQAGTFGHVDATTCERDLPKLFAGVRRKLQPPHVRAVAIDGDRAVATIAAGRRVTRVPFAEEDGKWRLAGFLGVTAMPPRDLGTPVPGATVPAIDRSRASVARPSAARALAGARCGPVRRVGLDLRGGCVLTAQRSRLDLAVMTAVGDMRFARCLVGFTLHVGGGGRAGLEDMTIGGHSVCSDLALCRVNPRGGPTSWQYRVPWRTRLLGAGRRGSVVFDACLDTCAGRFEGRLVASWARRGAYGRRLRMAAAPVGVSGLRMTGEWNLRHRSG